LDVSGPSKCAESLSNFNAVLDNSLRVRTGNFLRLNRELDRVIKGIFRPIREMRLLPGPLVRVQRERQPIDVNIIKFRHFLTSLPTENTFTFVLMPQICGRRKFLKGAGTNRACGSRQPEVVATGLDTLKVFCGEYSGPARAGSSSLKRLRFPARLSLPARRTGREAGGCCALSRRQIRSYADTTRLTTEQW